jgi:pilus assembly protein Flp/PilA
MKNPLKALKRFLQNEEGQGMVEYGLIIALVAIALIVTLGLMKDSLVSIFDKVKNTLNTSASTSGT